MILIISKFFALILATMVVSRSITDFRSRKESLQMTVFWIMLWLIVIGITFFPIIITKTIDALGGSRTGLGTILGMAIIFVLFISYRVYIKAHRIEKQVYKIARAIALKDFKNIKK